MDDDGTTVLPISGDKWFEEMHMGNDRYQLIDIKNDDVLIQPKDSMADVVPFII